MLEKLAAHRGMVISVVLVAAVILAAVLGSSNKNGKPSTRGTTTPFATVDGTIDARLPPGAYTFKLVATRNGGKIQAVSSVQVTARSGATNHVALKLATP